MKNTYVETGHGQFAPVKNRWDDKWPWMKQPRQTELKGLGQIPLFAEIIKDVMGGVKVVEVEVLISAVEELQIALFGPEDERTDPSSD